MCYNLFKLYLKLLGIGGNFVENLHVQYMKDLMQSQGIAVSIIRPPYDDIKLFDGGLREQLYLNYDFSLITERLSQVMGKTIYIVIDSFEIHYLFFKYPNSEDTYVLIGPYMTKEYQNIIGDVSERMKLSPMQIKELKEYYISVPRHEDNNPEIRIMIIANYIFGQNGYAIENTANILSHNPDAYEMRLEPEKLLSYSLIEERYGIEDAFLDAVRRGDLQESLLQMNRLGRYSFEQRDTDEFRNLKNMIITFNTLMRKSVQQASVHPAYIDSVSANFARAIESTVSIADLTRLASEMVRKYCRLVQDHSLAKNSKNVQKVLNYIDFHYTEQFTLNQLADIAGISTSYLSTQFKKETGMTITDHILNLRVRRALPMLATTALSISEISEKVGFQDYNYFTRIFKKVMDKSPSQYRKFLRQQT